MIMDTNLIFSNAQAISGAVGDTASTNILDTAPHLAANVLSNVDIGSGEEAHVIAAITTAVTGATSIGMQPVLQCSTRDTFDTAEKSQEFPLCGPLLSAVIVGSIAAATGILTVGTLTSGTVQVGAQVTGGTTPANTYITAQLTGTPGGVGTYQTNCFVTVAAPTGTNSAYTGRQVDMRIPGSNTKRYWRIIWRNSVATSTAGNGSAYIVKDPQNVPSAMPALSGFQVG